MSAAATLEVRIAREATFVFSKRCKQDPRVFIVAYFRSLVRKTWQSGECLWVIPVRGKFDS